MSININDIYSSQWLVNEELKKYCEKNNYPSFFISPHHIFHLKDTINYKAIFNNNYEIYNKYINDTNQKEHNENIFKNLLSNFDINKMDKSVNSVISKGKFSPEKSVPILLTPNT